MTLCGDNNNGRNGRTNELDGKGHTDEMPDICLPQPDHKARGDEAVGR